MISSPQPHNATIRRGELYWLDWSPGRGSEQTGLRPALVVSTNAANTNPRYGLVIVVTVSTKGKSLIPTHVEIRPTTANGLAEISFAKTEQIMTTDKDRLKTRMGQLTEDEMKMVDAALKRAMSIK